MIATRSHAGERVFLGLGSNLGDREGHIARAIEWLRGHPGISVVRCGEVRETEPWGMLDQPMFLNAVIEVRTTLSPLDLLRVLKTGEATLGRNPGGPRWGPRAIDLDILLFGDRVMESDILTVPHARLLSRRFVLQGLVDLDPALVHPATGAPLASHLDGVVRP